MRTRESPAAVLIYLCGTGPQGDRQRQVTMLEEQLIEAIERDGSVEFEQLIASIQRDGRAALYVHGANAERLFSCIEATLRASALCEGARVLVGQAGPDSQQREVLL